MADTGSPLAPGLFQGNVDALKGFEKYINANGGIGCRQLKVETWDSKLDPTETKNGQINACKTALALVGGNSLFNPDVTEMNTCADSKGAATGIAEHLGAGQRRQRAVLAELVHHPGHRRALHRRRHAAHGLARVHRLHRPARLLPDHRAEPDRPVHGAGRSAHHRAVGHLPDRGPGRGRASSWIGAVKVSGRDEQSAYTPRVQAASNGNANYVYNGSNDTAMINMRREAAAQGLDSVKVWACSLACYTEKFKAAGADVEGTYVWMQFLPFEEKGSNQELDNYLASVATPDSLRCPGLDGRGAVPAGGRRDRRDRRPQRHHPGQPARGAERHRLVRRQRLDGRQGPEGRVLRLHGHHADEVGGVRAGPARPRRARSTATPPTSPRSPSTRWSRPRRSSSTTRFGAGGATAGPALCRSSHRVACFG